MDNDRPVTRAELRAELKAGIEALEARIRDFVRETETHLLGAFYSYTESNHKRISGVEIGETNLRDRVIVLENRLTAVEKRLNMPPAQ